MTTEPTSAPAAPPRPEPPADLIMPGALIREARQKARLSVDELAAMMKIARPTIEAMERDDFGALLEPVYARGYYRKCAKLLGIDEKKLLDAYAAHVAQRGPAMPSKVRLASGAELGLTSRLPLGRAIAVAIGAIVFCALLWVAREATRPVPTVPAMLPSGAPTSPEPAPAVTAPAPAPTPEAAPASDATAVPPAVAPASTVPSVPAPAATTAPAESPAPAAAPPPGGALQMSFSADCWISVRDVNGKTLHKGLVRAGERLGFDGQRPLFVFLGKASAVSVQFEGRAIDLAPHTRENATAKLQLPLPPPATVAQ